MRTPCILLCLVYLATLCAAITDANGFNPSLGCKENDNPKNKPPNTCHPTESPTHVLLAAIEQMMHAHAAGRPIPSLTLARAIPPDIYDKAAHDPTQLTPYERSLLRCRGDLVGRALADPDTLTPDEVHQILQWPPPHITRTTIRRVTRGKMSEPAEVLAKAKKGKGGVAGLSDPELRLVARLFSSDNVLAITPVYHTDAPGSARAFNLTLARHFDPEVYWAVRRYTVRDRLEAVFPGFETLLRDYRGQLEWETRDFAESIGLSSLTCKVVSATALFQQTCEPRPAPPPFPPPRVSNLDMFVEEQLGRASNGGIMLQIISLYKLWELMGDNQRAAYRAKADAINADTEAEYQALGDVGYRQMTLGMQPRRRDRQGQPIPARVTPIKAFGDELERQQQTGDDVGLYEMVKRWNALSEEQQGPYEARAGKMNRAAEAEFLRTRLEELQALYRRETEKAEKAESWRAPFPAKPLGIFRRELEEQRGVYNFPEQVNRWDALTEEQQAPYKVMADQIREEMRKTLPRRKAARKRAILKSMEEMRRRRAAEIIAEQKAGFVTREATPLELFGYDLMQKGVNLLPLETTLRWGALSNEEQAWYQRKADVISGKWKPQKEPPP